MATAIGSLLRSLNRPLGNKLNILLAPTHERVESYLCKTGHNFYAFRHDKFKDWDETYAALPNNYTLLPKNIIPYDLNFDLVLFQNIAGQAQILSDIAKQLHLPIVRYEHTYAYPQWGEAHIRQLKQFRGNINVFITEASRKSWLFDESDGEVIYHAVDTDIFKPIQVSKKRHVFACVNDWPNRDMPCGFNLFQRLTQGLPIYVSGKSPGFSEPAKDINDLVLKYNEGQIFINTSQLSPVPCVLLEAMSCGVAIVTTATCEIPNIVINGVNGYISNNEQELRSYLEMLLDNPEECQRIGAAARQTILDRFSIDVYTQKWNETFNKAIQ